MSESGSTKPIAGAPGAAGSRAANERGPYIDHLPVMFAVDDRGFAWAVWEDGTMSMVVSTDLNYGHKAHAFYVLAPQPVLPTPGYPMSDGNVTPEHDKGGEERVELTRKAAIRSGLAAEAADRYIARLREEGVLDPEPTGSRAAKKPECVQLTAWFTVIGPAKVRLATREEARAAELAKREKETATI